MSKFNIINFAENVIGEIFKATNDSPKKTRCDFVPQIRNIAISILELVEKANSFDVLAQFFEDPDQKKKQYQAEAIVKIRLLNSLLETGVKFKYITQSQFTRITNKTFKLEDSIRHWM